jgi:hypothetical protein
MTSAAVSIHRLLCWPSAGFEGPTEEVRPGCSIVRYVRGNLRRSSLHQVTAETGNSSDPRCESIGPGLVIVVQVISLYIVPPCKTTGNYYLGLPSRRNVGLCGGFEAGSESLPEQRI